MITREESDPLEGREARIVLVVRRVVGEGTSLNGFRVHPGGPRSGREGRLEPSSAGRCPHSGRTPGASGLFYFLDALLLLFSC